MRWVNKPEGAVKLRQEPAFCNISGVKTERGEKVFRRCQHIFAEPSDGIL